LIDKESEGVRGNRQGFMGMKMKTGVFAGMLVSASFLLAFSWSAIGYGEEPVREYYANGKVKSEQSFKDGKLDGSFKVYFDSGRLRKEGAYKNGKREGPFKTYHENGQLVLEESYKNGKLDGSFKTYYGNGQLRSDSFYKDGKREGKLKAYDKTES
jgi:antitoxin component YwqK of YwqJK toxin-antitoxin module